MEIRQFGKSNVKVLSNVALTILKQGIESACPGVTVKYSGGKYSPENFVATFEFCLVRDGVVMTQEAQDLVDVAQWLGIEGNPVGMTFMHNGMKHELVGYKRRNRKYPFIAKNLVDGKRYKISETAVMHDLGITKKQPYLAPGITGI